MGCGRLVEGVWLRGKGFVYPGRAPCGLLLNPALMEPAGQEHSRGEDDDGQAVLPSAITVRSSGH